MPDDDVFKRYLEMWASMVGMSRERAEAVVRDLVASGEVARKEATRAADWLVERGRAGTEELNELIRRQIREQVAALGLATKDDVARLQAQVDELKGAPATKVAAQKVAAQKVATAKVAGKKVAPRKAVAATKPAGISRSASARRGVAGSPPAAGDAVPPKG
jgi:polyhydroxyalkanoate synthesis regulator phasin